jgi:hypothetical protein
MSIENLVLDCPAAAPESAEPKTPRDEAEDRLDELDNLDFKLLRQALDLLGHPHRVGYIDLCDAYTPKIDGEPAHEDGHLKYLAVGFDVTCPCVVRTVMASFGYAPDTNGWYPRTT